MMELCPWLRSGLRRARVAPWFGVGMSVTVMGGTPHGIEARSIEVEVDLLRRLPGVCIVGMAAAAVRESAERVRSAISAHGLEFPRRRVVVNLAPAGLPKVGAAFDLPIAVGVLAADGQIPGDSLADVMLVGELSLDGRLRNTGHALALALLARELEVSLILPVEDAAVAAVVPGVRVFGARSLGDVVRHLRGEGPLVLAEPRPVPAAPETQVDLADVRGQELAKRGLEIACAGALHIAMSGPPGCGKSMLARRIPGLLPPPSFEEVLAISRIHGAAGLLRPGELVACRPFRSPHHSITAAGMVGDRTLRPGEVSLAHHGVLFLDEAPEFRRSVLEVLRAPVEDREVTLTRASGTVRIPSAVSLVMASNPCPCGMRGSDHACPCTDHDVARYQRRLSGPMLDRVDLHLSMRSVSAEVLMDPEPGEGSAAVRTRVETARAFGRARGQSGPNGHLLPGELQEVMQLEPEARAAMMAAVKRWSLGGRGVSRLGRVSRTIADLEGSAVVREVHVLEALAFRVQEGV